MYIYLYTYINTNTCEHAVIYHAEQTYTLMSHVLARNNNKRVIEKLLTMSVILQFVKNKEVNVGIKNTLQGSGGACL